MRETSLVTRWVSWVVEAFARAGIEQIGPRLWAIVEEAGLPPLGMSGSRATSDPATRTASPTWCSPCASRSRSWWAPEWPPPRRSVWRPGCHVSRAVTSVPGAQSAPHQFAGIREVPSAWIAVLESPESAPLGFLGSTADRAADPVHHPGILPSVASLAMNAVRWGAAGLVVAGERCHDRAEPTGRGDEDGRSCSLAG
jgi:hypothetical protein